MSGPASGVMAAAATLAQPGIANAHHLRHGRHLDRRGADPRRRAGRCPPRSSIEYGHADPRADGRRAHRRRRRRLDRLASTRPGMLQVGPESAGADPGPDLLRPRRHRARPSPTPTWCSAGSTRRRCSRSTQPVTVERGARRSSPRGSAAPLGLDAGGRRRGRDPARQHAHGRRHPHGVAVARPRPARLRAVRLRRRRAAARRRRSPASSACPRCWCRRGRASPTRSAASSPTCATTSSTRSTSRSTALDMGEVARDPRGAARATARRSTPRSGARSSRPWCCIRRRHAVPRPDASHPRAAAVAPTSRATSCRRCSRRPISPASRCGCRRSAPVSSTSTPR